MTQEQQPPKTPPVEEKLKAEEKPKTEKKPKTEEKPKTQEKPKAEEKLKAEKQTNCPACNKPLKKIRRYYRDGKHYCTKKCWQNFIAKAKEEKKE